MLAIFSDCAFAKSSHEKVTVAGTLKVWSTDQAHLVVLSGSEGEQVLHVFGLRPKDYIKYRDTAVVLELTLDKKQKGIQLYRIEKVVRSATYRDTLKGFLVGKVI